MRKLYPKDLHFKLNIVEVWCLLEFFFLSVTLDGI